MRGGRFQQKAIEDANTRNAEALFETRTVVEIREVEARTRKEIEEKKEELRQLVGASYRDLIESADSILLMRKSCEAVADNIQKMEEGFNSLKNSITLSTVSSESDRERKRRESLFGIGSRVKYLVDTPEKIWGCLDEHMYLEGSERYLRAREVHSLLIETSGKGENAELLATFPLLRHQWPLVETFRGQISQRSRDRLAETGLKVGEYAIALAAVATIDELPSSQVFALFLEMRRMWLRVHLRHAVAGRDRGTRDKTISGKASETKRAYAEVLKATPPEDDIARGAASSELEITAAILCQLVRMIQASLCHVGELFLEVSGKMPLLFSTVLTAPPGSQLFGGIPNPEREVRLWKAQKEKLETRMGSLSAEYITESCVSWLRKCAGEIMVEGKLLLQRIKSGKELAEAERIVREDLAKQSALNESLDWLKSAFGSSFDSPWDCLCELLLKEPTNLWDTIFEGMFVSRMKEVIESGFHSISIDDLLKDALSSEASAKGLGRQLQREQTGGTATTPWISTETKNLRSFTGLEGGVSVWKSLGDEKDNLTNTNSFLNPEVIKVKDRVDEGMKIVLEDSLSFLYGPQSSARTEELASFLQEKCRLCMIAIVNVLSGKLSELSESTNKATGRRLISSSKISPERVGTYLGSNGKAPDSRSDESVETLVIIERALFLGRLSAALAKHSSVLPIILGPVMNWTVQEKAMGSRGLPLERENSFADSPERWFPKRGKAGNAVSSETSVKLKELQRMLRHQSISAHKMWVLWSAEQLTETFTSDLRKDDCLSTLVPLKGWEETCLKQEEETGGEVEMKLALPAMPSPYAVSFLFAGCQEIYRVGGHALDRAVLQFFAWKLCEKVLKTYEEFFSDSPVMNSRVSEKGLLQLLFDLRFLADVLSGGQDVSIENLDNEDLAHEALGLGSRRKASSAQSDKSTQARKKWVTSLLSTLPARLDPIDWATYEPHLWDNERRYYQRCAVLFGSLIQLNRLYTDTVLKLPSHADTNTLNMTGTVPRFTYLPISAPIFSVTGGSTSRMPRQMSQDDSVSGLWSGYNNSEDGYKYGSSDVQSQSSVASARPLIKSLMGQVSKYF